MIKVMLVDDNTLALEYFSGLIDWGKYGFELVCTAIDGEAALISFRKYRPQLVITDVQMPNMNGIELTQKINQIAPETIVIFLSSYEEFSYIRSALNLGVQDYILKHETKEKELAQKLLSVSAVLKKRQNESRFIAEGYFSDYLKGTGRTDESEIRSFFRHFPRRYDLRIAEQAQLLPEITELLQFQTEELEEKDVKPFWYQYAENEAVLRIAPGRYLILSRCDNNTVPFSYRMKEDFEKKFHTPLMVLVLAENSSIADCLSAYDKNKGAVVQKYFFSPSTVLYPGMLKQPVHMGQSRNFSSDTGMMYPGAQGLEDALSRGFKTGEDLQKCRNRSSGQIVRLMEEHHFSELFCQLDQDFLACLGAQDYQSFHDLAYIWGSALLQYHHKVIDDRTNTLFEVCSDTFTASWYDASSFFSWLKDRYALLAHIMEEDPSRKYSDFVRKIYLHIYQNYSDSDLSAESIADYFGTSVNQLNVLIKRETSTTVWQLLIQVRMEKAKQLLDTTELKIADISEQTGYKTISYFSNVFRKYYGVSPQEYRRKRKTFRQEKPF